MRKLIILFLFISSSSQAQKIASIEKSNCATKKYSYVLRELFHFSNNEWITIDDTNKSVSYYVPFKHAHKLITFNRKLKNPNYNSCDESLFQIRKKYVTPIKFETITSESFEHEELKEYQIISNSPKTLKSEKDDFGTFTNEQLEIIRTALNEKLKTFGLEPRNPICPINEINNNYIKTGDSLLIGTLKIHTGQCSYFALPGHAYGGGILHFIVYPNNEIKFLFANTELLEIADFNNNGQKEYLFYISNFNCYGYVLFYNNFEKINASVWSYH